MEVGFRVTKIWKDGINNLIDIITQEISNKK
jgi:hypothetical protein